MPDEFALDLDEFDVVIIQLRNGFGDQYSSKRDNFSARSTRLLVMPQVCPRHAAGSPLFPDDCIHLELHQPFRVDEAGDFDAGAGWPHLREAFRVRAMLRAYLGLPRAGRPDEEHLGASLIPFR